MSRRPSRPGRLPADLASQPWDGAVVLVAGTPWGGVISFERHMALELSAYAPVIYVDPPLSPISGWRDPRLRPALERPRLRLMAPGVARLTPVVPPGPSRPVLRDVAARVTRHAVRRATRRLGGDVHALVVATPVPLFGACGERRRVFYGTDDYASGADLMALDATWLRRQQERLLAEADTVVAVSPVLVERWRTPRRQPVLLPNGVETGLVEATRGAARPADVTLPGPIAGFVGHVSNRIDLPLLEAVAARGVSLLLVGPRQQTFDASRLDALLARPNVSWVGAKPFDQLAPYLAAMDVGLLPYTASEFNTASFPLKLLEYLAAGKAAVATDLPSVRWLQTDLVQVASEPESFADEVDRALRQPPDERLAEARRRFAGQHTWAVRARRLAEILGLPVDGRADFANRAAASASGA